jgi:hypothetical protein
MITDLLNETFALIAGFYDRCRCGYEGSEGYRKSTDLYKFSSCIQGLESVGLEDKKRGPVRWPMGIRFVSAGMT